MDPDDEWTQDGEAGDVPAGAVCRQRRQVRREGGRRKVVFVRVAEDEHDQLAAKAAEVGLSIPRLLVESALADAVPAAPERRLVAGELMACRRIVGGAANNLNQLAYWSNRNYELHPDAAAAVERINEVVARLDAAVVDVERGWTEQR